MSFLIHSFDLPDDPVWIGAVPSTSQSKKQLEQMIENLVTWNKARLKPATLNLVLNHFDGVGGVSCLLCRCPMSWIGYGRDEPDLEHIRLEQLQLGGDDLDPPWHPFPMALVKRLDLLGKSLHGPGNRTDQLRGLRQTRRIQTGRRVGLCEFHHGITWVRNKENENLDY